MPSINPLLLKRVLVFTGTGGSPLVYFGNTSNIFSEENRKFKWTIEVNQGEKEKISEKVNGNSWQVSKDKWQEIESEKWKTVTKDKKRDIYKLVFKKQWIKNEKNIDINHESIGEVVGLLKVSWAGEGQEPKIEEITPEESQNIWLIIAKGEKTIYLMPAVRTSENQKDQKAKEAWTNGITNIGEWKNQDSGDSGKEISENLKWSLKTGFSIARKGSLSCEGGNEIWRNGGMTDFDGWKKFKGMGMDIGVQVQENMGCSTGKGNILYENTSIIVEKVEANLWGGKVTISKYFPLDIDILGEKAKLKKRIWKLQKSNSRDKDWRQDHWSYWS
ncbi:hypothetical protein WEN_03115 [Mycoplasma wenyonii str. Massachusetts]|uniref:Uncharacterized protein n=1 Tax=Mycoplasma wenyonii (strain Massachusetts) TaxID=1197325 RepID=I6YM73_MYCWM|nr:hypothetical protein [Mycoplasma wenyonii]AFN65404.1 hypothetical protein WEN_03115 [Mycoplasma wenyonii str. Massachusetts]